MPKSLEPKRYAPFVCFGTNIFDGMDGADFKEILFPKNAAMDIANRNVAFICFADDLLPIGFAFF